MSPRILFEKALMLDADRLIIARSHPAAIASQSHADDRDFLQTMLWLAEFFNMRLLDLLVFAPERKQVSYRVEGLI